MKAAVDFLDQHKDEIDGTEYNRARAKLLPALNANDAAGLADGSGQACDGRELR